MISSNRATSVLFALSLLLVSCADNPTSSDTETASVKLSVRASTNGILNKVGINGIQSGMATITSANVVIEKIKFESIVHDSLDFRFRSPFVQDLALNGVTVLETIEVPFGSYKESEIEIDDLDREDGVVYTNNPELQNKSILVKGYITDSPDETFVYSSSFSEEQEIEFSPVLLLNEQNPNTTVVLEIDMSKWFVDRNGNFLDPRANNNREIIEHNIKNSIDAFEDHDDDGRRDHDDHHDDGDDD